MITALKTINATIIVIWLLQMSKNRNKAKEERTKVIINSACDGV